MRTAVWTLLGVLIGIGLLAGVQRVRRSARPLASRSTDDLLKQWEAEKSSKDQRVATFVLEDVRQGRDPLSLPPGEALPEPSGKPGPLAETLGAEPGAVYKPYDPRTPESAEALARELANEILRVHKARGAVRIVATGRAAGPAVKAARLVDGSGAQVERLITVGPSKPQLRTLGSEGMRRSANMGEWDDLWVHRAGPEPAPGISAAYAAPGRSGGGLLEWGLSQETRKALLGGASDEAAFDKAVHELAKLLAQLLIRGGSLSGRLKPEPGKELADVEAAKASDRGRQSGASTDPRIEARGYTHGSVGRAGGYDYGEAPRPSAESLRPGGGRTGGGSGAESMSSGNVQMGAHDGGLDDTIRIGQYPTISELLACSKNPKCSAGTTDRLTLRGTLTGMPAPVPVEERPKPGEEPRTLMNLQLCDAKESGVCMTVATTCYLPDGEGMYLVSVDLEQFRSAGSARYRTDDCQGITPHRDRNPF